MPCSTGPPTVRDAHAPTANIAANAAAQVRRDAVVPTASPTMGHHATKSVVTAAPTARNG